MTAWRSAAGGIAGPFEAWLALRGMKTLPLRIARQSQSAQAIAEHLAAHPRVRAVHYPGLLTGPALALAASFGGVESTWERRARWSAETAPAALIRLSVGIEPAGDLMTDIDKALEVL